MGIRPNSLSLNRTCKQKLVGKKIPNKKKTKIVNLDGCGHLISASIWKDVGPYSTCYRMNTPPDEKTSPPNLFLKSFFMPLFLLLLFIPPMSKYL